MRVEEHVKRRFWTKVEKRAEGCWNWTAAKTSDGYGAFSWVDKYGRGWKRAHRFAYLITKGEPEKPELHHMCNNPICVNPDHLQPMTRKEHMRSTPGTYGHIWANRTHCKKGHPLEGENLLPSALKNGYRRCRECSIESSRRWRTANPEKMKASVRRWQENNRERKRHSDWLRYQRKVHDAMVRSSKPDGE